MATVNKFCTQCGSPIASQSRFCSSCGAQVALLPEGTQAVPPASPPPVPPGYGQQPSGWVHYQQQATSQNIYPANNGGGNYRQPAGSMSGIRPQSSRGGKFILVLLLLAVLGGGAYGALCYLDSSGVITLPWSDKPDSQSYIGRWEAVAVTANGQTRDVIKERAKVRFEINQGANQTLTGKLTNTGDTKSIVIIELRPVKNSKGYEGTAKESTHPDETVRVTVNYDPASQQLTLTVFPPNEQPGSFHMKKL